ncbi:hypothetical protein NEAUS07_2602, partial [Nematocida ausubeli]
VAESALCTCADSSLCGGEETVPEETQASDSKAGSGGGSQGTAGALLSGTEYMQCSACGAEKEVPVEEASSAGCLSIHCITPRNSKEINPAVRGAEGVLGTVHMTGIIHPLQPEYQEAADDSVCSPQERGWQKY